MIPYLLIILAFIADRLTKWWAAENLVEFRPLEINEFLTFYPTYNRGVAFGMFQGIGPAVGWFSILIVIGLFVHMIRTPKRFWLLRLGLAMIIGGALGNLIDRITAGEVLDFIRVSFLPGIFNVSDVMVNVGMVVSLAAVFLYPDKEEEAAAEEPEPVEFDPVADEPDLVESEGEGPEVEDLDDLWTPASIAAGEEGDDEEEDGNDPGGDAQPRFPVDIEQRS